MLTKLTILGKSDAAITMIIDNLESCKMFPELIIVNNLNLPIEHTFDNPKFKYTIVKDLVDKITPVTLGVANAYTKLKVVEGFDISNLEFINIINRTSFISSTAILGKGLLINNFATIGAHAQIGNFVNIGNRASVNHHSVIEDFASINPSVTLAGHVHVGRGTLIGIGATISNGITIGKNSIIGAGAVVVRDIPDNVVAYGNPCKPMRENG
jgi:sugar O-acyltransferase (sialic acid O-acetyltransferase NeuD family)